MAQNDYKTFGDSGTDGVNKLSLSDYTADNDRVYGNGYTTKVIRSQLHNKALQQTSKMSAALAQFLANNGQDALDTDSFSTLATKIGLVSTFVKIDTIASLRAMTSTPSTVYVTGYTTANDNAFGSNFFKWNSTSTVADNGGTIIKLTNTLTGRYELQYNGAVNVKWFGADVTGVADSTTSLQNAINATQGTVNNLFIPAGFYQTTATLNITKPISISGISPARTSSALPPYTAATFTGTMIYLNHLGKGFYINNVVGKTVIEAVGTVRNQTAPTATTWVPIAADYDFAIINASDTVLLNLLLLNPTKGISSIYTGRLIINGLRMHAFNVGIYIDEAYDTNYINDIHQWPFWSDDPYTRIYTENNLTTFLLQRVDNPFFSNIFSIFAAYGILFSQSVNGATNKFHGVNIDLDLGTHGIYVDTSVTNGVTAQLENYTAQGSGVSGVGTTGINIEGNNSTFLISSAAINDSGANIIRIYGTGNNVQLGNFQAQGYDLNGLGYPAIEVGVGNTISIANNTLINGGGTAPLYGGAGTITGAGVSKFLNPLIVPNATATNHAVNLGQFPTSKAGNGYQKLPNGLIMQWGAATSSGTAGAAVAVTFPIAFPTAVVSVITNASYASTSTTSTWVDTQTTTTFNLRCNIVSIGCYYYAIGY